MCWDWIRRVSRAWACSDVEYVACKVQRWWLSVEKQAHGIWDVSDRVAREGPVVIGMVKLKGEDSLDWGDGHVKVSKGNGL